MKKVKFVSGFNARVALAACAVAGFSLIGCDKEDFTVDVPNIEITTTTPEVNIDYSSSDTIIIGSDTIIINNEYSPVEGAAYLMMSTTATTGETIGDVTYTILDAAGETLTDDNGTAYEFVATSLTVRVPVEAQYSVVAAKNGYHSNSQFVNVPSVPQNQILTVPVNIVLEAVDAEELDETVAESVGSVDEENTVEQDPVEQPISSPDGGTFAAGVTYQAEVKVPTGTYITEEQKEALYSSIDALSSYVATRATVDDLTTAKDYLRAKVANYQSSASTVSTTWSFVLSEEAASVSAMVTTTISTPTITFSVWVNDKRYEVTGECTVVTGNSIEFVAEGVDITHAHDHGNSSTSGGGVGGDE